MFVLKIKTANAAFHDHDGKPQAAPEVARILRELATALENDSPMIEYALRDVNGNRVGTAQLI